MARPKTELQKHTLNLRPGDFKKMGELFPDIDSSLAIRTLISRFVDKHYSTINTDVSVDDFSLPPKGQADA